MNNILDKSLDNSFDNIWEVLVHVAPNAPAVLLRRLIELGEAEREKTRAETEQKKCAHPASN